MLWLQNNWVEQNSFVLYFGLFNLTQDKDNKNEEVQVGFTENETFREKMRKILFVFRKLFREILHFFRENERSKN